ncbi:helix-turn-helix domain-containing protein [Ruegeria sp. HKCCD4884]|uniref:helix-turn-helix domain-containing protein n=1 Tax=Ruegeria sp. HKCCD4884 TaxID=2683022 RepID=UPI001493166B|nr:helix-turn-helix transcriptional regulator [Ruegeria sp. HKCCD4884]NOD91801.1 helix-turn-helix domain-containing protein [Ruegeria sp. HKCCD4884]
MTDDTRSPEELRAMFSENLRRLAQQHRSISALCRKLGVNRTQFNRYLTGESVPRPDVLDRICRFFDVDARILLKPLDEIEKSESHPATSALTEFLGSGSDAIEKSPFAPGFYAVIESLSDEHRMTLLHARPLTQCTLIRGYVSRAAMPEAPPQAREIQGIAACSGDTVYMLTSQRGGHNSRVYLISPDATGTAVQWRGSVVNSADTSNPEPVVLKYLGHDSAAIFAAARLSTNNLAQHF